MDGQDQGGAPPQGDDPFVGLLRHLLSRSAVPPPTPGSLPTAALEQSTMQPSGPQAAPPLFQQSAMARVPPPVNPALRALGGEFITPEQIAAQRREGIGNAVMALGGGPGLSLARRLLASPRITGALTGAAGMLAGGETQSEAGDTVDPRLGEANRLQANIERNQNTITTLGTTRTPSPAGTQAATIKTLQGAIDRDSNRLREIQDQLRVEAATKNEAEKPFAERFPGVYQNMPIAAWGTSALGGMLAAKGGAPLRSIATGAGTGMLASTAATLAPTVYNAETLPPGSPNQQQAYDQLRNPDYWKGRVAPAVGMGMLTGALGGEYGSYLKRLPMPSRAGPGALPPPTPTPGAAPAAIESTPSQTAPSSPPKVYWDRKSEVYRERGTGRFSRPGMLGSTPPATE